VLITEVRMEQLNERTTAQTELNGGRFIDPEYRDGYARGFADAVDFLAECAADVSIGIMTVKEFRAIAAERCAKIGELRDETVLPTAEDASR